MIRHQYRVVYGREGGREFVGPIINDGIGPAREMLDRVRDDRGRPPVPRLTFSRIERREVGDWEDVAEDVGEATPLFDPEAA